MLIDRVAVREHYLYGFVCKGIFAIAPIKEGELVWEDQGETDHFIHKIDFEKEPDAARREQWIKFSYMTGHDTYSVITDDTAHIDPSFFFNHSCDGNTWFDSEERIIAKRDIKPGEQLTYDYALTETEASMHYGMMCRCGAGKCRGKLTFTEWRCPKWQAENKGHWSSFIQQMINESGWHDPRVSLRYMANGEKGLFTRDPVKCGESLIIFAGKVVSLEHVLSCDWEAMKNSLQIHDKLWQVPAAHGAETGDAINHCCDANCGMEDSVTVVAIRDIAAGEQITIDYATVNSGDLKAPTDNFECCFCGAAKCRKKVTSSDWMLPEVQQRYWPYFPPFMKRLIEQSKATKIQDEDSIINNITVEA